MAFAVSRSQDTLSDMNITPLVDVMLVLLVIFMVTAPMMDFRLPVTLPQATPPTMEEKPEVRQLGVAPGDVFTLDGIAMSPAAIGQALAEWHAANPSGVLKIAVDADADYQSATTAMATARRAGIENLGFVDP